MNPLANCPGTPAVQPNSKAALDPFFLVLKQAYNKKFATGRNRFKPTLPYYRPFVAIKLDVRRYTSLPRGGSGAAAGVPFIGTCAWMSLSLYMCAGHKQAGAML
jgi:hypothetical protein